MLKPSNYDAFRTILGAAAMMFRQDESLLVSKHYFTEKDLTVDDSVKLPEGKVIKVTVEYADKAEIENG